MIQEDFVHKVKPVFITDIDNKEFSSLYTLLANIVINTLPREQLASLREFLVQKVPQPESEDNLIEYKSESFINEITF